MIQLDHPDMAAATVKWGEAFTQAAFNASQVWSEGKCPRSTLTGKREFSYHLKPCWTVVDIWFFAGPKAHIIAAYRN